MRNLAITLGLLLANCAAAAGLRAAPIQHDFIAIDEGMSNLFRVDESDAAKNWLTHIGQAHPRDMQLEGDGKLLISLDAGYAEYDVATGKLLKEVTPYHDVSAARRLANGDLLLGGMDFDGVKKNKGDSALGDPTGRHIILIEFNPQGQIVRRTTYVGDYLRLVRETAAGTYLFVCDTMVREADKDGHYLHEWPVKDFSHAWKAIRLPDGDVLASAGYGTTQQHGCSFIVKLDPTGKVVQTMGAADQVPPAVHPYFYSTFQWLPNGDVVTANWQGHGMKHGRSGVQVLEFDPQGKIVWQWDNRQQVAISSIQAVLVLDGLNPAVLNDERNGAMGPVAR